MTYESALRNHQGALILKKSKKQPRCYLFMLIPLSLASSYEGTCAGAENLQEIQHGFQRGQLSSFRAKAQARP